jgi:Flp pilus assembly pilin Flp
VAYQKARQQLRGQTMTEYALILAAVAIVVYVTYAYPVVSANH